MYYPQVTLSQTSFDMGTAVTIDPHAPSGWTVDIEYVFGSPGHVRISTSDPAPVVWTFPVATLAPQIPYSSSSTGSISATYYDAGQAVWFSTTPFTAIVPASVVPTLGSIEVFEGYSTTSVETIVGQLVQGLSEPTCMLDTTPAYGSPIAVRKFTVNGIEPALLYWDDTRFSTDLPTLSTSDPLVIVATVTDSRGHSATTTRTVSVLPYGAPRITAFAAERCDSDGVLHDDGTSIKVTSGGSVSSLVNATEKNQLTWTVYSRIAGATSWGAAIGTLTPSGLSFTSGVTYGSGAYSTMETYEVLLQCSDRFSTTMSVVTVTTALVALSLARNGVGVGKVWGQGALDIGGDTYLDGDFHLNGEIYQGSRRITSPAGIVSAYAGSTNPPGWEWARGQSELRAGFPDLFAAIGTTYGADDAAHFTFPNLGWRVPVGGGDTSYGSHALGETGGEETHALTEAENGPHAHGLTNGGTVVGSQPGGGGYLNIASGSGSYVGTYGASSGSGTPHNNMQPWIALNYIIKT